MDTGDPSNHRPISNLNTMSKVLERLFVSRLMPHVSDNFCPLQSAYRKHHSTETAVLKITNDLFEAVDAKKANFGGWNILSESAAPLSAGLGPTYFGDLASSRLALHSPLRSSESLASRKAHHSGRSYFRCSSHHSVASSRGLQYRITNMLMTISYTLLLTKPQPRAHLPP